MISWTVVMAILGVRVLSIAETAVIEKANVLESPREYYERIKNIPVDDITQEVDDRSDALQRILLNNPLLRQLSMFTTSSTQSWNLNPPEKKVQIQKKNETISNPALPPRSLNRPEYKPEDNNFDDDYERVNETYFENVDIKVDHEIRRRPTGRTLYDGNHEPPIDLEYDDEEPFAVTQSLLNSIEHAEEAVTRVNIETLKTPTEEDDTGYGPSPLDSSATTQKAPSVETRTVSTVLHTEDNINWSENYQQVQGSPGTSPYLHGESKTHKQPGLKKSSFQGMFFMPEDLIDDEEREQWAREINTKPSVEVKPKWSAKYDKAIDGKDRNRVGNTVATKRREGGYVVSGTRYYFDNRIDVDVEAVTSDVMKEDYGIRENSREQIEMMKDPRFAVEVELAGVKIPKTKKYVQDGIKLHTSKISQMYNEPDPKSMVSHKRLGDRLFERRVTEIGGKQVTVELGNKHLHGVDLIVRPGSVVHGPLPSDEEKAVVERSKLDKRSLSGILIPFTAANHKSTTFGNLLDPWDPLSSTVEPLLAQSDDALELPRSLPHNEPDFQWSNEIDIHLIERCFFVRTDTELTGSPPIMKYIGESKRGCIVACARDKRCHSMNYSGTMSTCEIFDEANATTMHMQYHLGYTFYMPKRTDVSICLNDVLKLDRLSRSPELEPNVTCGDEFPCKTSVVLDVLDAVTEPPTHYRLLPSKAECSRNTAVLFIRSAHSRNEKGRNLDTVSDISEDDCLFSCLTNQAADSHPVRCASAEYDEKGGRCTLSSEPRVNGLLTEQPSVTFYEKICVAQSVSTKCSGAAVDRTANMVVVGFMRDTATTDSIEECIERCVGAEIALGFQCLSIMYYYDETVLNCILNDASIRTNPESITEVNSTIVDYFGVDDCYGLPEATDGRQNFLRIPPTLDGNNIVTERLPSLRSQRRRTTRALHSSVTVEYRR